MFKKLLEKVGRKKLLWAGKAKTSTKIIDYGKFFNQVNRGLILLPENLENFGVAINKQKALNKSFPNTVFVYIVREKYISLIPDELQDKIIPIHQTDITAFGVPKRQFLRNAGLDHFDIIIDLNANFDLVSTYISNKTEATLRICLCHPHRDPFYNLQVCTPDEQSIDQQINIMIKYISQFKTSAPHSPKDLLPA